METIERPSDEEKKSPILYAQNVAKIMAEKLAIPISDWSRENGYIMDEAKRLGLSIAVADFNFFKISKATGLDWKQMRTLLTEFKKITECFAKSKLQIFFSI